MGHDQNGIDIIDPNQQHTYLANVSNNERTLSNNTITALYEDATGTMWVGTYKKGLSYYNESAFFGGIAGILELSRKEKGTVFSGVAIATALMPPLCTVGYGIASLNWQYAVGALYLFFINCLFIALATFLAVKYLRFPVVE